MPMTEGCEPPRPLLLRNAKLGPGGAVGDIAIEAGRVVDWLDPEGDAEIVDVDGRVAIPGLYDAHVHFDQWASVRQRIDLTGTRSAREAAERVAAAVDRRPAGSTVVRGYGFRDGLWPDTPHKD